MPMLILLVFAGVDCRGDSRKPSKPAMARTIKLPVVGGTRAPLTLMGVPASKSGELTTMSPEWSSWHDTQDRQAMQHLLYVYK